MSEVGSSAALRVILVGPTGLDGVLRREPAVELVRARTALDAIGELADPIDGDSPERTAVVVHPEAEPRGAELAEFVAGLRRVQPEVWVLRVERNGDAPPMEYDGTIGATDSLDALLSICGVGARPDDPPEGASLAEAPDESAETDDAATAAWEPIEDPADVFDEPDAIDDPEPTEPDALHADPLDAAPSALSGSLEDDDPEEESAPADLADLADDPTEPEAPTAEAALSPDTDSPWETTDDAGFAPADRPAALGGDDSVLARCLLEGDCVLEEALKLIRSRTGAPDVVFVAEGEESRSGWSAWTSAEVRTDRALHGQLRSRTADAASLGRQAAWLGVWLDLESHQDALLEAAYTDPLTGAHNRRYFDEFLPEALRQARADRRSLTILLFDIDDFKRFNDQHGHAAGDEILVECVRMLEAAVRPTDRVCRMGGDEFAVIFDEPDGPREPPSHHPTSVFDIADRFRRQCRSARFPKLGDDAPGHLTISGGLATFPWDGATAEELLERADRLALEGKALGKNVIAIGPGGDCC